MCNEVTSVLTSLWNKGFHPCLNYRREGAGGGVGVLGEGGSGWRHCGVTALFVFDPVGASLGWTVSSSLRCNSSSSRHLSLPLSAEPPPIQFTLSPPTHLWSLQYFSLAFPCWRRPAWERKSAALPATLWITYFCTVLPWKVFVLSAVYIFIYIYIYIFLYICVLTCCFPFVFCDRQGSEANLSVCVVFHEVKMCLLLLFNGSLREKSEIHFIGVKLLQTFSIILVGFFVLFIFCSCCFKWKPRF